MIEGKCVSNIDEFKNKKWPKVFIEVPEIGSYIESEDGTRAIVQTITHCSKMEKIIGEMPFIEIYVHKEYLWKPLSLV